ncbi:MAG: cation:proton antiporter [Geminicoccaceae bacterium]
MYQNAALLALLSFLYVLISGRVERSWLSGPILFVAGGFLLGPGGLAVLSLEMTAEGLRLLAELTLAMVLFSDAATADLARIRRSRGLPERLLLIGLPLAILAGMGVAWLIFPGIGLVEMALLAAILAPTDAALGEPVVANREVPPDLRATLSFESGLNDGICVPVVVLLAGFAIGTEIEGQPAAHVLRVIVEELGIGFATGAVLAGAAAALLRLAHARNWIADGWRDLALVAVAIACFTTAQALGGSGFIACFVGGLVVRLPRPRRHELLRGTHIVGDGLALLTWVAFGAAIVWQVADRVTLPVVLYALLSLTVVRMLPVYLCLMGSKLAPRDRLFVGWFGPRGLASIVFALLILDTGLPHLEMLEAVIACTVLLSVLAHGMTANPLVRLCARRWRRNPGTATSQP